MIALLFSEAGRMAAALGAMVIPSAHAQDLPPMVEVAPDVWSTRTEASPVPPSPKDRSCVRNWRRVYYAAQAADIASTIYAIESGKGREGGPLYRALFGKNVKSYEVLGLKAVMLGAFEFDIHRMTRVGDYRTPCQAYKIGGIFTGGLAMVNLRVVF